MLRFHSSILTVCLVAALCLVPAIAALAASSQQVVFSGGGIFPGVTPFGFWIWCESSSSNPYFLECNGAMYFYALGIVKHVAGTVTSNGGNSFTLNVVSTADDSVACALTNVPPATSGPTNTVDVNCTAPGAVHGVTGTSRSAVVQVTGP